MELVPLLNDEDVAGVQLLPLALVALGDGLGGRRAAGGGTYCIVLYCIVSFRQSSLLPTAPQAASQGWSSSPDLRFLRVLIPLGVCCEISRPGVPARLPDFLAGLPKAHLMLLMFK